MYCEVGLVTNEFVGFVIILIETSEKSVDVTGADVLDQLVMQSHHH
jgi:hypothetical protein